MAGKTLRWLVTAAFFALIATAALQVHETGVPGQTPVDDYYIMQGQVQTGANNIVSSILFDYRGMDTIGEASVLFAAASAVMMLFRRTGKDD